MKFDRFTFFKLYRSTWGALEQSQVTGLEYLLTRFELESRITSLPQLAYVLGTVKHESADTWQPVKEIGMRQDEDGRWYNVVKGKRVYRRYGSFFGRGYVQITWKTNYEKFGKLLGKDLVNNPDLALDRETAYDILIIGMTKGLFTGKKLDDYMSEFKTDYVGARKIINGTDRDDHIAVLARKLLLCLNASVSPVTAVTEAEKAPQPTAAATASDTATAPPEPSKPEEPVSVQKVAQSLGSKVMAGGTVTTGLVGTLLASFMGLLKNPYAMAALTVGLIIGCALIGAWVWNRSKERQVQIQLALIAAGASKDKNTVELSTPPPASAETKAG